MAPYANAQGIYGAYNMWKIFQIQSLSKKGWPSPRFTDANTDGIQLKSIDASRPYGLDVNEEIPWEPPFKLVNINYDGSGTPTVQSFKAGNAQNMILNIQKVNDQW